MSDYQAIAGVSATLKALLEDRMSLTAATLPPSQRVTISLSHPDVKPDQAPSGPRLNLFLYEISHSPFLRNQELAGPGAPGYPPLALELHYMLTCFPLKPADDETMHLVLGDALRALHDTPVLSAGLTRTRGILAGEPLLAESLRSAYEQVKLSFVPQNLEITARVWESAKEAYRLSAAFTVSIVQIESQRDFVAAAPVRETRFDPAPGAPPAVMGVTPAMAGIGQLITISGAQLGGPATSVRIGGVETPVIKSSATELVARVPDAPAIQPGPVRVQVFGGPRATVPGGEATFMLVPVIAGIQTTNNTLILTGTRLTSPTAPTQVIISGNALTPAAGATDTTLTVDLNGIPVGSHQLRVRVGNIETADTIQVMIDDNTL